MGNVILVTGGARSGKSSFSEHMFSGKERVLYIATAMAFDEEMKERITLHKAQRSKEWETLEAFEHLEERLRERGRSYEGILLDCITVLLTNRMFTQADFNEDSLSSDFWVNLESQIALDLKRFLSVARKVSDATILVTNEIGSGLVPESSLSRAFRDMAGRINQLLARESDEVYLVVSGIPLKIKGGVSLE